MKSRLPYLLVIVSLLAGSCHHKEEKTLFQLMADTGIRFENKVTDGSVENSFYFRNYYNGGGVAIGDLNNDGFADVILTSNMGDNKVYLNKGGFKFDDITGKSGLRQDSMWSTGVTLVDINNDGWLDIYICNSGHMKTGNRKNKLYINNHDLTFTESASKYGLDISAYSTQISFFDYDLDGDLDCFLIDNSPMPINDLGYANRRDLPSEQWPVASFLKGGGDHLYRNDNGQFTEVSKEAGIHGTLISFGLGVSIGDINGDGYPDIYVSNDSYERDYLYINQKDGTFRDELEQRMGHISFSSMGADMADINNDGFPEIFTTDMLPEDDYRLKTLGSFDNIDVYRVKEKAGFYHQFMQNTLQLNNKKGKFMDVAHYSGVAATDWSWGALLFDADNDGWNDIYVCNGVNRDLSDLDFTDYFANDIVQNKVMEGVQEGVNEVLKKMPKNPLVNKAYKNNGDLQFTDIGTTWGFTQKSFSNGAAYGDLDNDGALDLIVNNENGPAFVFKNNSREINKNNYIGVLLKGKGKNTFAIGSKIKIYKGGQLFYREVMPSRGFQSSVDYKQIIGLGKISSLDSMVITWPDRSPVKFDHPEINKVYNIQQKEENNNLPPVSHSSVDHFPVAPAPQLLTSLTSSFEKHQEDDYVDFHYERNLPKMLSREGPKTTVGDVNGDGLADIFIGGTRGHPGQLYLQIKPGQFVKSKQPAFDRFPDFEDEAVLLFDADQDGDPDLFIGPGGNNNPPNSRQMQFRFFRNDGKGNFTLDAEAFPTNAHGGNTGIAVAGDFNKDGYMDLFIGGRSVPGEYGSTPASYLFINDGKGHFTDIAPTLNPEIAHIGMVTGAVWTDLTGDKEKELVITGEWMAPRIFSFKGNHFEETPTNLNTLFGWWQTITAADVNGDGRMDLILGNIGENFYLRPDSLHPVKLWVEDFDRNNILDKIMTRTIDGRDRPVFLKHDLESQIPSLKKQNLRHAGFAQKTIQELFPGDLLDSALVRTFNYPSSIVAINEGKGKFSIRRLPTMVQLSSVNAIQCIDINQDGFPDLVLAGNEFGFLPQFGRLDASYGHVLLNDGKGQFTWIDNERSGLEVPGVTRDIAVIPPYLLFLQNDEFPALYRINTGIFSQKNRTYSPK